MSKYTKYMTVLGELLSGEQLLNRIERELCHCVISNIKAVTSVTGDIKNLTTVTSDIEVDFNDW